MFYHGPHLGLIWGMAVVSCGLMASIAQTSDLSSGVSAGRDAWHSSGLFAFRTGSDSDTIQLVRLSEDKLERLFATNMQETVKLPVCLADCVIVANTEGVVSKFNLQGALLFSAKPVGFDGLCSASRKFNSRHILLTEVKCAPGRKKCRYYLHIIDISGTEPVIAANFRIKEFGRLVVVQDTVLILNVDSRDKLSMEKIRVPKRIAGESNQPHQRPRATRGY